MPKEAPNSTNLKAGLFNPILNRNSKIEEIIYFANTMAKIANDSLEYIDLQFAKRFGNRDSSKKSDEIFLYKMSSCFQYSLDEVLYEEMNENEKKIFRKQNDNVFQDVFYNFSKDKKSGNQKLSEILSTIFYGSESFDNLRDPSLGKKYFPIFYLKRLLFKQQFLLVEGFKLDLKECINGEFRDQQGLILLHLKRILLKRKSNFIGCILPELSNILSKKNKTGKEYRESGKDKKILRGSKDNIGIIEALNHSFDFLNYSNLSIQDRNPPVHMLTGKNKRKKNPTTVDIQAAIDNKRNAIINSNARLNKLSLEFVKKVKKENPIKSKLADFDDNGVIENKLTHTITDYTKTGEIADMKVQRSRTTIKDGKEEEEKDTTLTTDQMIKAIYDKVYEKKEVEEAEKFKDFINKGKWKTLTEKEQKEYWGEHGASLMAGAANGLGVMLGKALLSSDPEERIKAFEEFGKSLLIDQGTELLSLLATLWGGPIAGAFVQGLAGTFLGGIFESDKPDPIREVQKDIRDLRKDIHRLSQEMREGFNNVYRQNNLIIDQNQDLEKLIRGLSVAIEEEFKKFKTFISDLNIENHLISKIGKVKTPINQLERSYDSLFYSTDKDSLKYIDQNEILEPINEILSEFITTSVDINNVPIQFESDDFKDSILIKLIDSQKGIDFTSTISKINHLCDITDLVFKRYEQVRDKHFSNNAIIAFVEPQRLPEKCTNNFMDTVLESLVSMERLNEKGLKGALNSYGSIFKSNVIGTGNMYLFNAYLRAQSGEAPTAFDGLFAAEVGDDGKLIFEDKAIPKMLHFDDKSNVSFKSEISRIYIDNKKPGDYTGFIYKNAKNYNNIFPVKTRECKFYLGKRDTIILDHEKINEIRILPPDVKIANDAKNEVQPFVNQWENIFSKSTKIYINTKSTYFFFDHSEMMSCQSGGVNLGALGLMVYKTHYLEKSNKEAPYVTFQRIEYNKFQVVENIYLENKTEDEDSGGSLDLMFIDPLSTRSQSIQKGIRVFKDGDVSYSDNLKYRVVLNDPYGRMVVEQIQENKYGHDEWQPIWSSCSDQSVNKKGELILSPCSGFRNNFVLVNKLQNNKTINLPMPQAAIKEIKLTDHGELRVIQDLKELENRVKEPERRLIMHELKKGESLYAGEFIYERKYSDNILHILKFKSDGNLEIHGSDLNKDEDILGQINLCWSTKFIDKFDQNCVLMITNANTLEIQAKKPREEKNLNFKFPQKYVENLYLDSNNIMINHKVENHVERRLFLYGLKDKDVMYPGEKITSPNGKYHFVIELDGNMKCEGIKTWSSEIRKESGIKSKFEFKRGDHTFELFDGENKFSGFFTYFGSNEYKSDLRYLWASKANMHKAFKVLEESNMKAILMDDSGYLLAWIRSSYDDKEDSFDIGLVSSKNTHSLPIVKPENVFESNYLGFKS